VALGGQSRCTYRIHHTVKCPTVDRCYFVLCLNYVVCRMSFF
jgi:hypothetical protein